jgi:mannose-6-phosphate isomerase
VMHMQEILMLTPVFKERIWGGKRLKSVFGYEIPYEKTGECWAISAHPNGDCVISNGPLKGQTLSQVFNEHKNLFNDTTETRFPLLTKILDADQDLSVQVHPDDHYALKHENDLGKTECWYILDAKQDATMIYGHYAHTKLDLIDKIHNNQWHQLLRRIPIKKGDFFYVPSGTIHALCEGTMVLETQQSSDTTYRVYDYNRKDDHGNQRPLHIEEAIKVTNVPHFDTDYKPWTTYIADTAITTFIKSSYFTVQKWDIMNHYTFQNSIYRLVSVIDGKGSINGIPIQKADHFIITSILSDVNISGHLSLVVSHV